MYSDAAANQKYLTPASTTQADEQQIWMNFLCGDDSALSYVYRSYADTLYNYGRQFAEAELVQDAIQDTFFDLIKYRGKLGQVQSIKGYLFACLRRKIVKKIKRNKTEIFESDMEGIAKFQVSIAAEEVFMINDDILVKLDLLKKACNELSAKQREAIMLYYYEKLSYQEVADIMGMSRVSSARILIYRALDTLKLLLSNVKDEILILFAFLTYQVG